MEKLYYTASLDDISIGLEYECEEDNIWNKYIINDEYDIHHFTGSCIDSIPIRVKYLDVDDLIELGYKVEQKPLDSFDEGEYWIKDKNDIVIMDLFEYDNEFPEVCIYGVYFRIKNKYELKKLLNQLNIN